jgi:tRNA(fMet)-specific endonuclease VapC
MGLILDTSILIAAERQRFRLPEFFAAYPAEGFFIASITASELLHAVERAIPPERKIVRSALVEQFLINLEVLDFDLSVARRHAGIWAFLERNGLMIGPYDLIIAATALACNHRLATLNLNEFRRVPSLQLADTAPFVIS